METRPFFPFAKVRPGQATLITKLYQAVKTNKHSCFDAANGIGKTVSVLASTLPVILEQGKLLIYCARTHSQMNRVLDEIQLINEKAPLKTSAISLKGKKEMCINRTVLDAVTSSADLIDYCNSLKGRKPSEQCPFFRNFREQKGKITKLFNKAVCSDQVLISEGYQMQICPYELSRSLLSRVDVVITTYNYLIHPEIQRLFFNDINRTISECVIVFDESHNLPDIAMNANSDYISLNSVLRAKKELKTMEGSHEVIEKVLDFFADYLEQELRRYESSGARWSEEHGINEIILRQKLVALGLNEGIIQDAIALGRQYRLEKIKMFEDAGTKKRVNSSLNKFGRFLSLLDQSLDDHCYFHELEFVKGKKQTIVRLHARCLDARPILVPLFNGVVSCLSGTLRPVKAFCQLVGYPSSYTQGVIPSPFRFQNICCLAMRDISTRYAVRTPQLYSILRGHLREVIENTPGNVGIFCASYEILSKILNYSFRRYLNTDLNIPVFREYQDLERSFSSTQNEEMIQKFKKIGRAGKKAVLFGVCGGRNSEGVDFPGNEMRTVVIVGFPLLRPSIRLEALETFYKQEFGEELARLYAYQIPAIRKSNQAAGRPIRKIDDHGAIIFLDERFTYKKVRKYLASWLTDTMRVIPNEKGVIAARLKEFDF